MSPDAVPETKSWIVLGPTMHQVAWSMGAALSANDTGPTEAAVHLARVVVRELVDKLMVDVAEGMRVVRPDGVPADRLRETVLDAIRVAAAGEMEATK